MRYVIKISPLDLEIPAEKGKFLDEALREAGVNFLSECGGQGTCGNCAVKILSGIDHNSESEILSRELIELGFHLACQTKVDNDLIIELPEKFLFSPNHQLTPIFQPEIKFPSPADITPLTQKIALKLPPDFKMEENISDLEFLLKSLPFPAEKTFTCLSVLKILPEVLRHNDGFITVTLAERNSGREIIRVEAGDHSQRHYGLACDVGTTTIALKLLDLNTGQPVASASAYNSQIECGADIIARIIYAQKPDHLRELNQRVLTTINRLIEQVRSEARISRDEISSATFAGNTTMTHLLMGINPKYIREEPYNPVVKFPPLVTANELKLNIHPLSPVLISPGVGSYVGGDITSGLLFIQSLGLGKGIGLFIDIGTNGELVIFGEDWAIGCACSAGPAFEGVGIKCGMRAVNGAIESVNLRGSELEFKVIGNGAPRGICGSGLIELLSEMFLNGIISRDGKYYSGKFQERLRQKEQQKIFLLTDPNSPPSEKPVFLSEQDIGNLIRAKAAIFSATALLLKRVGLKFNDLGEIYIAGGFGCSLNIAKAIGIGLFPALPLDRFRYLGNSSLAGAQLALLSKKSRKQLVNIAKSITYIDLSSEPEYMNEYTAALFLPHTDENLFPTT